MEPWWNPGGTLVEPWWNPRKMVEPLVKPWQNPRGTFPQTTPDHPAALAEPGGTRGGTLGGTLVEPYLRAAPPIWAETPKLQLLGKKEKLGNSGWRRLAACIWFFMSWFCPVACIVVLALLPLATVGMIAAIATIIKLFIQ